MSERTYVYPQMSLFDMKNTRRNLFHNNPDCSLVWGLSAEILESSSIRKITMGPISSMQQLLLSVIVKI